MSRLSENIKYLRETTGVSQEKFGKAFGVSRDNIASYERGTEPKIDFLTKMAKFYHLSIDNLIHDDLKQICEGDSNPLNDNEKLDLKIRPNLDLKTNNLDLKLDDSEKSIKEEVSGEQICKMQLKRIENLSGENALLKKENKELKIENTQLKAENAQLQGKIEILKGKASEGKETFSNAG